MPATILPSSPSPSHPLKGSMKEPFPTMYPKGRIRAAGRRERRVSKPRALRKTLKVRREARGALSRTAQVT